MIRPAHSNRVVAMAAITLLSVALAACGRDPADLAPTSAGSTATPPPGPAATQAPAALAADTPGAGGSPTAASPAPAQLTVGELAGRIASAWSAVTSYRTTFTTTAMLPAQGAIASPGASPAASPATQASPVAVLTTITVVDEVVLPDRRHRVERTGGEVTSEVIIVGDRVFVRGMAIPGATPAAGDWLVTDFATFSAASADPHHVEELFVTPAPPYSGLSEDERARIAHPIGTIEVGGRLCEAYRVADATLVGEPLEIVVALDGQGLPCSIRTVSGELAGETVFEINVPITVEAPV